MRKIDRDSLPHLVECLRRIVMRHQNLLIISLALHVFITLPLVTFVVIDGSMQQQIYTHVSAHFGTPDIAFIGDSLTAGGHVWATKIGVYNLNIKNYGMGGFTTEQVAYYADRVASEKFKFCFVMSGRNDKIVNNDSLLKSLNSYIALLQTLRGGGG
jgi:hypothetical protein